MFRFDTVDNSFLQQTCADVTALEGVRTICAGVQEQC